MLDSAVHDVHVQHTVGFDPHTLLPARVVTITYSVGPHGPFTDITTDDKFTAQYIEDTTNKRVVALRSAGLLPA